MYRSLQQSLLNALNGNPYEEELNVVLEVFGDDPNAQLKNLRLMQSANDRFPLKRIMKTYLRATATNQRCSCTSIKKTDSLNLIDVANKFAWKENRREIFGMFNENDVKPKAG